MLLSWLLFPSFDGLKISFHRFFFFFPPVGQILPCFTGSYRTIGNRYRVDAPLFWLRLMNVSLHPWSPTRTKTSKSDKREIFSLFFFLSRFLFRCPIDGFLFFSPYRALRPNARLHHCDDQTGTSSNVCVFFSSVVGHSKPVAWIRTRDPVLERTSFFLIFVSPFLALKRITSSFIAFTRSRTSKEFQGAYRKKNGSTRFRKSTSWNLIPRIPWIFLSLTYFLCISGASSGYWRHGYECVLFKLLEWPFHQKLKNGLKYLAKLDDIISLWDLTCL